MSPERESATPFRPFIPFVLMIGLLTALTGMVVAAPTAQAADSRLLVGHSVNGPWQAHFSTPLFDSAGALVPLEEVTSGFYVKNNSLDFARATVSWAVGEASDYLAKSLRFSAVVGGSTAPTDPSCGSQVTGPSIPPGGVQRIDVAMRVADMSASRGMGETADVSMQLHLAQVVREMTRDLCTTPGTPDACLNVVGNGCPGTVEGAQSPSAPPVASAPWAAPGAPVPTVVDAGAAGTVVREAGRVFGLALAAFLLGVVLLVASRRRVATQPVRRPNENMF